MTRLVPLLLLVAAATAGCGPARSSPPPSSSAAVSSGVRGTVLLAPTCPVERSGQPPCQQPVATTVEVDLASSGAHVATAHSDASGAFSVALAPGIYTLVAQRSSGGAGMVGRPVTVTVPAGGYVRVTLVLDTGIR